jgi:nicotinamide riboside kinase
MAKAVIIYGPQGSGKTQHAEVIARAYGKTRIIDGYDVRKAYQQAFPDDALVLTNDPAMAALQERRFDAEVVQVETALAYARAH